MLQQNEMKLVLEDGSEYCGVGCGASRALSSSCGYTPVVGEVIFNTSMVGYQEILSDPSYAGQIVVMTYPLIGQYGINDDDFESQSVGPIGVIAREICSTPSNFRSTKNLSDWMEDRGIAYVSGIDTRDITAHIRKASPIKGAIVPSEMPFEQVVKIISETFPQENIVERISCRSRWFSRTPNHEKDIVVIDCGLKRSVVRELNRRGCNVTVMPFNATAEEILSFGPDGVLISSGPGEPSALSTLLSSVSKLKSSLPLAGIGLGHQIIALSYGASIIRLPYGGYHGGSAVRECSTGRIFTAELNHVNAVDAASVEGTPLTVTYVNVLDGVVEGLECVEDRVLTCEFTPEGGPGPQESGFFDKFINMIQN